RTSRQTKLCSTRWSSPAEHSGDASTTSVRADSFAYCCVPGSRWIGFQVDDQEKKKNSESDHRIFQRYNRRCPEETQSRDRSEVHDLADRRRELVNASSIDKLPNQTYVGRAVGERAQPLRRRF